MSFLEVKNLKMHYETLRGWVKAVDDVTFGLDKGDTLGLAGESGCGKTSAALSILKLLPNNAKIFSGRIKFKGQDLLRLPDRRFRQDIRWKKISTIFQGAMNALHPTTKVGDQITEALLAHEKISKNDALERAGKLLDLVGIGVERINRYPHELSGGMKQRVMIAMSLACNPDLVIADEPTTALDVIVAAQVLKVIKELQEKLDLSMILITHDLSLISEVCNKVVIMYAGKIVEQGDIISIFKEPLHPYTQKLIGAFPSVLGPKEELTGISGFPPDLLNPPPGCRFHPRCSYAMPICKKEEPITLNASGKEHKVACHLIG
jgi:peptide/nickel transport system ATP-binding protein